MINVLFFAQTRELIGIDKLELPCSNISIDALRQQLSQRGKNWTLALEKGKIIHTLNQVIVSCDQMISAGDEVAFFPPVTGG